MANFAAGTRVAIARASVSHSSGDVFANDLSDLRMLWFGRVRRRFPVSKLARVAPKAQNASCGECFERANQAAVLRRKETSVRKLLHLIRQANKITWHVRPHRFLRNAEGNLDLAFGLRVKTCCSQGAGCGGKEFSSCEHKTSRFIIPGPTVSAIFGKKEKSLAANRSHSPDQTANRKLFRDRILSGGSDTRSPISRNREEI